MAHDFFFELNKITDQCLEYKTKINNRYNRLRTIFLQYVTGLLNIRNS